MGNENYKILRSWKGWKWCEREHNGDEWKGENNSCQRRKLTSFLILLECFGGQVWKCDWNKSGVG